MAPSFKDLLRQNEFWAFLFILGWVLFNWPLISMTMGRAWLGIPAILAYVALIWSFFILALYLFDRGSSE
jgi:TRAP-type C4-dicarboxylate transport system permease small subunit